MRLIISMVSLAVAVLPALADRQVTEDERAKLSAAVQAEGCSGGKFELDEEDDQQFEVDDAVCADGKKYDLKFDMQIAVEAEKSGLRGVPSLVCRHHIAVWEARVGRAMRSRFYQSKPAERLVLHEWYGLQARALLGRSRDQSSPAVSGRH